MGILNIQRLDAGDHATNNLTPWLVIAGSLDSTRASPNTSRRKATEAYLIHRGQTLEPSGMNL